MFDWLRSKKEIVVKKEPEFIILKTNVGERGFEVGKDIVLFRKYEFLKSIDEGLIIGISEDKKYIKLKEKFLSPEWFEIEKTEFFDIVERKYASNNMVG